MSNEAAIDWFARNAHEWPSRDEVAHCWPPSGIGLPEYILLSKDQWLARRAELQNKPITSIEDNQDQDMAQQAQKQPDNSWFERGEFPPVGVACEIHHKHWSNEKFHKVKVLAITYEHLVVRYETFEQHYLLKDMSFRPIRTERELAIEEMTAIMKGATTGLVLFEDGAAKLYDAGYRKEPK